MDDLDFILVKRVHTFFDKFICMKKYLQPRLTDLTDLRPSSKVLDIDYTYFFCKKPVCKNPGLRLLR